MAANDPSRIKAVWGEEIQEVCGKVYETYYVRLFLQLDRVLYYTTPEVYFNNERHAAAEPVYVDGGLNAHP